MARSDDDCDRNRQADEEQNPFIVFRRYADEQMASLLQGLIGLPSALTHHSSNERWLRSKECEKCETRRQENEMKIGKPSRYVDSPDQQATRENGAEGAVMGIPVKKYLGADPGSESDSRAARQPAELSDDLGRPYYDHTFFPASIFGDSPFQRGLITRGLFSDALPAAWPFGYLIFSPYSPLRLEQQEHLREHGSRWRDAFEDLLAVQAGQVLPELSRGRTGDRDQGAGEWVATLLAHGFADGRKRIDDEDGPHTRGDHVAMEADTRHPESDAEEDAGTELDLYERLFASSREPVAGATNGSARVHAESASVISALTTTERRVMPDGSVHTKVMLKKKFADGREESSETVHTTQSTSKHIDRAAPSVQGRETDPNAAAKSDQGSKRKGWFWSD